MTIRILTKDMNTVEVNGIREMSHTKDNMVILVPLCGTCAIKINDQIVLYSELPSFDARMIKSIDIKF